MRKLLTVAATLLVCFGSQAAETDVMKGPREFVRQYVACLMPEAQGATFFVAEQLFAMDNGEPVSKKGLLEAWPEFQKAAFKKRVSLDEFFRGVDLRFSSPLDNKRLMSNKRVMKAYTYQKGDLYCDASRVKQGVESSIQYEKAFIFLIRKIDKKWTLIAIGG